VSGSTLSGRIASQGAGEPPSDSASAQVGIRRAKLSPVTLVIATATLLALALRLYQLTRPGLLLSVTEYDDGPYFGSAIRLVNGSMPYRDFLLVQPPGITLLMVPAALLSKVAGTAAAMAAGRILTSLAGAAAVVLAGILVRHRGIFAVVVVCGISAVYPDSVQAAHTVLVEPWLVLFCLLGALAVFEGDHLTRSSRRLAWGGAAFGFAGAVEIWAIVPVIVLALLSLRSVRRLAVYLGGVAVGFLVPVAPFAIVAPHQFYRGVITAQVGGRTGAIRASNFYRLKEMTGLTDLNGLSHSDLLAAAVLVAGFVFACLCLEVLVTRRLPPALDMFAVVTGALVVAAFMWPNQFHYHFGAFLAPFLAMSIALPAASLLPGGRPGAARRPVGQPAAADGPVGQSVAGGQDGLAVSGGQVGPPAVAARPPGQAAAADGGAGQPASGDRVGQVAAADGGAGQSAAGDRVGQVAAGGGGVGRAGVASSGVGQAAAGGGRPAQPVAASRRATPPIPPALTWYVACLAGLAIVVMAGVQVHWESTQKPKVPLAYVNEARRLIPAGACVVTDEVSFTIMADRFVSNVPGCPLLVDSIGTDYGLSHGRDPAAGAAKFADLVAVWRYSFGHAQYVWLSGREQHRIPWTPALMTYFRGHFTRTVAVGKGGISGLYRRDGL
jgi:hypothetical protein